MSSINNSKGTGGELIVAAQLIARGFSVSKPFDGASRYDLIADNEHKLTKVQVKTLMSKDRNGEYHIGRGKPLARGSDVVIFYVQPEQTYFIIPASALGNITAVSFSHWSGKRTAKGKWDKYLNAWHLLEPKKEEEYERENNEVVGSGQCDCCRCPVSTLPAESLPA